MCSPGFVNNTDCTHILVHGDNTSDHLAISVSLHLPADIKFSSTAVDSTFKFRWDRADLSYYQAVLTSSLSSLSLPIDACYVEVLKALNRPVNMLDPWIITILILLAVYNMLLRYVFLR